MNLEQTINHVIANGAKIEERLSGLGTILPTQADLDRGDRFAAVLQAKAEAKAVEILAGLARRDVGGEIRYWFNETIYCAVNRYGVFRWFEVRKDGDYATKDPR